MIYVRAYFLYQSYFGTTRRRYLEYDVCFNNSYTNKLKIDKGRRYFARVTEAYKRFGLIADDGSFKPTNAVWTYSDGNIKIKIN